MFRDGDEHIEIAGRTAVVSRLPFPRNTQARPFIDARRNLHGKLLLFANAARTVAGHARIFDHFSRAAALRTGTRYGEETLRVANLTAPSTAAARHRRGARFRSAGAAVRAADDARHVNGDLFPENGILECEVEIEAKIVSAGWARAAPAAGPEEVAEAKQIAQDVAEIGELAGIEPSHPSHPRVAVAVVARALL